MHVVASVQKEMNKKTHAKISHMIHDGNRWVQRSPQSHPTLFLSVEIAVSGYRELGLTPPAATKRRAADMIALPDPGCQACCMGLQQLYQLGLSQPDLLTPNLDLKAANSTGIDVVGVVFITRSGQSFTGKTHSTDQMCYVARNLSQLLLSKDASQQLGIVSTKFPTIGDHNGGSIHIVENSVMDLFKEKQAQCSPINGKCSCLRRVATPEPPRFDPTLSKAEMKAKIIRHYAASVFNRCSLQPLPTMSGEPMPIVKEKDATPVAVHTPAPVPVH